MDVTMKISDEYELQETGTKRLKDAAEILATGISKRRFNSHWIILRQILRETISFS